MNAETANKAYDILMQEAGAKEYWRSDFVRCMTDDEPSREYRFSGALGFGGKYWIKRNAVDCYSEDLTPEREAVIKATNARLASEVQF